MEPKLIPKYNSLSGHASMTFNNLLLRIDYYLKFKHSKCNVVKHLAFSKGISTYSNWSGPVK